MKALQFFENDVDADFNNVERTATAWQEMNP